MAATKLNYAICYEVWTGNHCEAKTTYVRATTAGAARYQFFAQRRLPPNIKIVAIAPAIGAFTVEDKTVDRFTM